MASVKHLGLFPWCVYRDLQQVKDVLAAGLSEEQFDFGELHYTSIVTSMTSALAMYWRVKTWNVSGVQRVLSPAHEEGEFDAISFSFNFSRSASSEKDLVCIRDTGSGVFFSPKPLLPEAAYQSYSATGFDGLYTMYMAFQLPWIGIYSGISRNNMTCHHYVGSSVATHWSLQFNGNDVGGDIDASDFGLAKVEDGVALPCSINFLDETLNINIVRALYGDITDLVVQATEYWPYDPEDGGGPIYDTSSGAIIRPDYFNPQN